VANNQREVGRIRVSRGALRRKGALLSSEMMIVFPVMMILLFGVVETSLLLASYNTLKLASSVGARVATVTPGDHPDQAVVEAVNEVLANSSFLEHVSVTCHDGGETGGICRVTVQIPMEEAAPDLLGVLGFHLTGVLEASTAMRKE